ncbi:MAG: hypothetical protein HQ517_14000 [SAR324 cluster bacterium]|nr:hypothetical protein [SAR324 cluster bacterium]
MRHCWFYHAIALAWSQRELLFRTLQCNIIMMEIGTEKRVEYPQLDQIKWIYGKEKQIGGSLPGCQETPYDGLIRYLAFEQGLYKVEFEKKYALCRKRYEHAVQKRRKTETP